MSKKSFGFTIASVIFIVLSAVAAYAGVAQASQTAETRMVFNTISFMVWGAFVMWMCAGFCMLEAGSVRTKNVSLICLKNVGLYSIAALTYYLVGYNIMYVNVDGFIGTFELFYNGAGTDVVFQDEGANVADAVLNPEYSPMSLWLFQMVFLTTTVSIVSGTLAERVNIWSFFIFVIFQTIIIYPVIGAWAWGGGWLAQLGFQDFAGSTAVHATGGAAALAAAIVVGGRRDKFRADGSVRRIPPSNVLMATLGVFILWMGWFGFNSGSQFSLGSAQSVLAMSVVMVNTNLAACAGLVVALVLTRPFTGTIDLQIVLNGTLAGLVAISAGPDFANHGVALLIGGVGGFLSVVGAKLLEHLKIDDGVGTVPVHLFAGIWGTLAVGFSHDVNLGIQLIGTASIAAYAFTVAFIVWNVLDVLLGARASIEAERIGLDEAVLKIESYPEFIRLPEPKYDD